MRSVNSQDGSEQVEKAEVQSTPASLPFRRACLFHHRKPMLKQQVMEPGILASGVCHQSTVDPAARQWQIKPPLIVKRGVFLLFNSHKNDFSTERFISIMIALIIRQNFVLTDLKFCFFDRCTDQQQNFYPECCFILTDVLHLLFFSVISLQTAKLRVFLLLLQLKGVRQGEGYSHHCPKKKTPTSRT